MAWAKLLAGVGEEFPLLCPACGGDIRLIAFITEPGPIRKILTHLGEPLEPPTLAPARGPPAGWGEFVQVHDDRDVFHASPDELPAIDIHSLWPVPDARSRQSRQVAGLGETPSRRQKSRFRVEGRQSGNSFLGPGRLGRREQPAHESFISRATLVEVPLTGLSLEANGTVAYRGEEWARGNYPRSFVFDPAGWFLACCDRRGDNVALFAVDRESGTLPFTSHCAAVGNPSHAVYLDLAAG